ncbi:MAG: replication-associated recombination protein A [Candidatus Latescibacterota bacterium]
MELPFSTSPDPRKPLAERMRPNMLDEFIGQEHIVGPGTLLREALDQGVLSQSVLLWGPPGCGKTTLARLIVGEVKGRFVSFSAVTSGIAEVKRVVSEARKLRSSEQRPFFLFVDEIHRFNKAQQDAFLPHVEDGTIVFIGATTENPSFEVIAPLLSRSRVFVLEALTSSQIMQILRCALGDKERGLGKSRIQVADDVASFIADEAQGDARVALNALEYAASVLMKETGERIITRKLAEDALQKRVIMTDKGGEAHYNLISALHKTMRGGDADASLYWLARMMEAGEDPLYIARRLVRFASEDVGNADPRALALTIAARDAAHFIGYPECKLALAQAVVYLALAPKSNAVYTAYSAASRAVRAEPPHPVPHHIRNAPTTLMKELGYGKNYDYPHNHDDAFVDQEFFPEAMAGTRFYHPKGDGFEKELKAKLEAFLNRRKGSKGK